MIETDLQEPMRAFAPVRKLALIAEVATTFARVRWLMSRQSDIRRCAAEVREGIGEPDDVRDEHVFFGRRLGHVVVRVVRFLPGDTRCLARSLVLLRMLARRGVGATLVIGVRPSPDFGAHAWVELGGLPLTEPIEPGGQRLSTF